jgi:hypothetical protein
MITDDETIPFTWNKEWKKARDCTVYSTKLNTQTTVKSRDNMKKNERVN